MRQRWRMLFLLILLSLAACGRQSGADFSPEGVASGELPPGEAFPFADSSDSVVEEAVDGMYITPGAAPYYVYYWDAGRQEVIPLCGKAECSHEGEGCNAYYGVSTTASYIVFVCYDETEEGVPRQTIKILDKEQIGQEEKTYFSTQFLLCIEDVD